MVRLPLAVGNTTRMVPKPLPSSHVEVSSTWPSMVMRPGPLTFVPRTGPSQRTRGSCGGRRHHLQLADWLADAAEVKVRQYALRAAPADAEVGPLDSAEFADLLADARRRSRVFRDGVELTRTVSRRVGLLLAGAGTSDVVDATVVDAAIDGDEILTSDPDDLQALAVASGKWLVVTPI